MAILDIKPNEQKNVRAMTALEEEHARLIGTLMCGAKLLQYAEANYRIGRPQDTSAALADTLVSLLGLYQGNGHQMEKETLALAELLGFTLKQHYIRSQSGGVH